MRHAGSTPTHSSPRAYISSSYANVLGTLCTLRGNKKICTASKRRLSALKERALHKTRTSYVALHFFKHQNTLYLPLPFANSSGQQEDDGLWQPPILLHREIKLSYCLGMIGILKHKRICNGSLRKHGLWEAYSQSLPRSTAQILPGLMPPQHLCSLAGALAPQTLLHWFPTSLTLEQDQLKMREMKRFLLTSCQQTFKPEQHLVRV